jgi:hypothetical protein
MIYQDRNFSFGVQSVVWEVHIWFSPAKPIDNYILDFFVELMLGIEVDGYSHDLWSHQVLYDKGKRMNWIGILFWDLADEHNFKDMKMWFGFEFYILMRKTQPLSRGSESDTGRGPSLILNLNCYRSSS